MSTTEVRIDASLGDVTVLEILGKAAPSIVRYGTRSPQPAHRIATLFPGSRVSIEVQENNRTSGHD